MTPLRPSFFFEKFLRPGMLPLGLFLLCLAVRIALISKGPYHVDTLSIVIQAQATLKDHQLHFLFGTGYPLIVLLAAGFIWLGERVGAGDPVLAVNAMSVIFSSLTVVFAYYVGKALLNPLAGIISALILSVSPIFLGLSVYGKSHMPSLLLLMAGIYFLIRYHHAYSWRLLFLSALLLGLAGATRLQDLCLMSAALLFLFFVPPDAVKISCPRPAEVFVRFFLWGGFIVFVLLAFHAPFFLQENRDAYINQLRRFWAAGLTDNYLGPASPRLLLSGVYLVKTLTEVGALLSVLGLLLLVFRRWRVGVFLALWVAVPVLFYGNLNTTSTSRFFVLVLPPLCFPIGYCLSGFLRKGRAFLLSGLMVFIIIISLLFQYMLPKLWVRHTTAALPEYCLWVAQITEPDAVIIAGDEALFMIFYSKRQTFVRPRSLDRLSDAQISDFKKAVDGFLSLGRPVYISAPALYAHDKNKHFSGALEADFCFVPVGRHRYEDWHLGSMTLQIYHFALYKVEKKILNPPERQ